MNRDLDGAVVEGYMDRVALRKLGFEKDIFESAERSVEDIAEDLERSVDRLAILTDFDQHGKKANRELRHELQGRVDVIGASRKEFGAEMTSEGRMDLEDVLPLYESKEQKFVDALLDRLYFRS